MTNNELIINYLEKIQEFKRINADDVTKPEIIRRNKYLIKYYKEMIKTLINEEN